jgi:hypothetical protein
MSNIKPSTPSFVFGYWRPWKENSNLFDSYFDYSKDVSLAKYGADTVGKYINQASKQQVQAINQLGQAIGRGMNVLSNQMSDVNDRLGFLNRNMDIQVEQLKLSNLLLQKIAELLRVPDSEKERQHSIELGIKFFVNAKKDSDLYTDSLEELLKAESLMKQDYFVLHRIGCIYLHVNKYINPEKALDYFLRAAKYASVESDPKAMRLVNALRDNLTLNLYKVISYENELNKQIQSNEESLSYLLKLEATNPLAFREFLRKQNITKELFDENNKKFEGEIEGMKKYRTFLVNSNKKGISEKDAQDFSLFLLEHFDIKSEIIPFTEQSEDIDISEIQYLAADSYEKAAFSAYVIGRFEDAVNYQSKALKFNSVPQNRFLLAKYQIRNGEISEGVINLEKCIDEDPIFAIAVFKEIDFINEPEVLSLISNKNQLIDNNISKLKNKWKEVNSIESENTIEDLTELSQKSYEIKVSQFKLFEKKANEINKNVGVIESEIDTYISVIKETTFFTLDANAIQNIIDQLLKAKGLPIEKISEILNKIKKQVNADVLQIGMKYAGGIVFYIDETGKHGLVCAEIDFFGDALWGCDGDIGANEDGLANGYGMRNTKKIVENASWFIEKGFFSTTKKPAPTAARLCLESKLNGFSDWYLPTNEELKLMYKNLYKNVLGNFKLNTYWSSTDYNQKWSAWALSFKDGVAFDNVKSHKNYVRAVRAF